MPSDAIDWPEGYDRTPADEREPYPGNISLNHRQAFKSIPEELEKWGAVLDRVAFAPDGYVNDSNIPHKSANPDDPGVAVYFRREGEHADQGYALACDRWDSLRDNARAISLYVRRKRLAERCEVATAESEFSTAALPSGDDEEAIAVAPQAEDNREPHEVLGVAEDAPDAVVKGAARQLLADLKPNGEDGDLKEFIRVQKAKEAMLEK